MTASILFSYDIFAEQQYGGISRYFAELHRGLLDRNRDSWIVTGVHVNEYIRGLPHVLGIPVPPSRLGPIRVMGARAASFALERALLARLGRSTIYHKTYYGPQRPPSRVPVVLTVYDMIHELFPQSFSPSDPTRERKKHWCERADLILAISQKTKDDIVAILGTDPAKIVVTPLAAAPAAPSGGTSPPAYFLYVGDRRGYKNFRRTAEAFARAKLGDATLVCYGGGGLTTDEHSFLDGLGIRARVSQTGGSDGDLARFYRDAIAFVYPSEYEGFGIPPLEAMAQGCPVICSTGGSIPEVCGDAVAYVAPTDVDALAAAMTTLATTPSERTRLSTLGRARCALYSWARTVELTMAAYDRLA